MKIEIKESNKLPVAIIKNYYTNEELNALWDFVKLSDPYKWFNKPEQNGGAKDLKGNNLKHNRAVCIDDWFTLTGRQFCPVFSINRKLWDPKLINKLEKEHYLFNIVNNVNRDTTFLNYYENDQYYDYHTDMAIITTIFMFYKDPKKFTGGELLFKNDLKIECDNNTLVIFPSILKHRAEKVKMKTNEKLCGRFSMTQFLHYK